MTQMKTYESFNDREVILKHQYKFTSNVKALHPLKGNLMNTVGTFYREQIAPSNTTCTQQ